MPIYNETISGVNGTGNGTWVITQLLVTPANDSLVVVDAYSTLDGTQLLSAYAEDTGVRKWVLSVSSGSKSGFLISIRFAFSSYRPFHYVLTFHLHANPSSSPSPHLFILSYD